MVRRYNNLGEQVIKKEKYNNLGQSMFKKAKLLKKARRKTQKKADKKRKRNPFMIGSDARPWKGLFGLKKWLIK